LGTDLTVKKMSKKPKTIFTTALISFLAGFILLLGFLAMVINTSYRVTNRDWRNTRARDLENIITNNLGREGFRPEDFPPDVAVFVYNPMGELVFSNRGAGRRRLPPNAPLKEIRQNGDLLGFYNASSLEFHDSYENREFFTEMGQALIIGLILAVLMSFLIAWLFARNLSRPAKKVELALGQIRDGNLDTKVQVKGPLEIHNIAVASNDLASILKREHELRARWGRDIAHDLRTPIAGLNSQFDAIIDGLLTPDGKRMERLKLEVNRIEALVNSFEDLMALESPNIAMDIREFELVTFFDSIRERFFRALEIKNCVLNVDSKVNTILADESLMFRALSNLVDNAIKYGDADSEIIVGVDKNSSKTIISVNNFGVTIPEDARENIFERLFRLGLDRDTTGSGLGLTIVKQIAELHGGKVKVESTLNEGTTFTLEF
jgi:two-component system, OmpR family, sensor histidine kinase BaeS